MLIIEENAASQENRTNGAPIELVTENGYTIVRSREALSGETGRYKFIVSDSEGRACEVIVGFDSAAIRLVQRCRKVPLSSNSTFWINCAERSLAVYLWEKNQCPPHGRLRLKEICLDDLDAARRWDDS